MGVFLYLQTWDKRDRWDTSFDAQPLGRRPDILEQVAFRLLARHEQALLRLQHRFQKQQRALGRLRSAPYSNMTSSSVEGMPNPPLQLARAAM